MLFCGRQCIGLRGSDENVTHNGNPGNFLACLKVLGQYDDNIKRHLEHPKCKNGTYISPQIQNELIDIIGIHIHVLQKQLVNEYKMQNYFLS